MAKERMTTSVTIRLTTQDREVLERMAEMERRKVSDMARIAILEAAARRGLAREATA